MLIPAPPYKIYAMPPYPWQEQIWQEFIKERNSMRAHHATILYGAEGLGLEMLAVAMSKLLLCQATSDGLACNHCKSCELHNAGSHPDLFFCSLQDKAQQIKVEQIREIGEFVTKTSQLGGMKCIIISPAEAMNINAANALLKNLEEPAGNTRFLLVTSQLQRLLPTIRSRCGRRALASPDSEPALAWLESQNIDNADVKLSFAANSPLTVTEWERQGLWQTREEVAAGLNTLLERGEPMMQASQWKGLELRSFIDWSIVWSEGLIRLLSANNKAVLADIPILEKFIGVEPLMAHRFRDKLLMYKLNSLESPNLNPAMIIDELALDWSTLAAYLYREVAKL